MRRRRGTVIALCLVALVALVATTGYMAVGSSDPEVTDITYVAMGDSFTSAPGVPITEEVSGCHRSSSNYPAVVAEALDASYEDVSCGAASTVELSRAQVTDRGSVPPQLDALSEETDLVTLGIGVNDNYLYVELFGTCVELQATDPDGAPCRAEMATEDGQDRLVEAVEALEERLVLALTQVTAAAPNAQVMLVGYPHLVPEDGYCPELPLAVGDHDYVRDIWSRLGQTMRDAATAVGVTYVDLLGPSDGHDVCAGDDAWVNGVADPERAAALHPLAEGQQAVARLILANR